MDLPSGSKRSRFKRWVKEAKDDVKHGLGRVFGSSPTSRSSTPGPHSRQGNREAEERADSNVAAKPTNEDAVQVPTITVPTPMGPESQLERVQSDAPAISSPAGSEFHPDVKSPDAPIPDLAQDDDVPAAQETDRTNQPQAPIALLHTILIDTRIAEDLQPPEAFPSAGL